MLSNIDINKIMLSNKFPLGEKYFIGYKDNKEIIPLYIYFPEMGTYKRYSGKTKCMYFMIKDEIIFGKNNNKGYDNKKIIKIKL